MIVVASLRKLLQMYAGFSLKKVKAGAIIVSIIIMLELLF